MTTRIDLYNGALLALGERQLASLSENRAPRRYLDVAWNDGAVDHILAAGQWTFARRSVRMDADATLEPEFGWQYAFNRPTDYIRALAVCSDEYFSAPFEQYAEEAGVFYAALTPFYLAYVSNAAGFGGNLAKWPANVVEYAKLYLASRILPALTGNRTDKAAFAKDAAKALVRAQSTDAMEGPTKFPPSGTWTNARLRGRTGRWDRGSRTVLIG